MNQPDSPLLYQRYPDEGVAVATLNRPVVLNALNPELLRALLQVLEELRQDREVGCLVLHGAGRAFCAGADIKAMSRMDPEQFGQVTEHLRRIALAIRSLGQPVVAAVHGYALAGGFELMCLCDIRLAAADARLGVADADVGLSPTSGLTWLLPRMVGLGWAKYLTLAAPVISGEQALALGLVQEAVPAGALLDRARELARAIAAKPRLGIRLSKQALDRAAETGFDAAAAWELEAELLCFLDEDTQEAFRAFVEKRRPVFRHQRRP